MSTEPVPGVALARPDQIALAERNGDVESLAAWWAHATTEELLAKRTGMKAEANAAGETKVRCERSLGRIDDKQAPHGGSRRQDTTADTLAPLAGFRRNTRAAWRKLGKLSDKRFDQFLDWAYLDEESGVSTARLVEYLRTGSQGSSTTFECYTPAVYIEAARQVLGQIDLDPASSVEANETVKAKRILTEDDDGLAHEWHGTVWLNPPYGRKLTSEFVTKLVEEYEAKRTTAAILLINAYGFDASWFQPLWDHLLCFTDHRIPFYGGGPTFGSLFVYLGPDGPAFGREFVQFGVVVARRR